MKRNPQFLLAIICLTVTLAGCSKKDETLKLSTLGVVPAVTGNVTYTLVKSANPTTTEQTAYNLITTAMDTAVYYMNHYTTFTNSITVTYVPSVATADGNINGSIRFGSKTYYMNAATALH